MNLKLLDFPEEINSEIEKNLKLVLNSGFWSTGPVSIDLEEKFSKLYKSKCITTSSGGTALQLLHDLFCNIKKIEERKAVRQMEDQNDFIRKHYDEAAYL